MQVKPEVLDINHAPLTIGLIASGLCIKSAIYLPCGSISIVTHPTAEHPQGQHKFVDG